MFAVYITDVIVICKSVLVNTLCYCREGDYIQSWPLKNFRRQWIEELVVLIMSFV